MTGNSPFIAVAADCKATRGTVPTEASIPSAALRAFRMIREHPYRYTSDDVLFAIYADKKGFAEAERAAARRGFFSEAQPCLRASDLGKKYGWGIHSDGQGGLALYGVETATYAQFVNGEGVGHDGQPVTVKHAMRSRR